MLGPVSVGASESRASECWGLSVGASECWGL